MRPPRTVLLALAVASAAPRAQPAAPGTAVTAEAGPPSVVGVGRGVQPLAEEAYRAALADPQRPSKAVPITRRPPGLSPRAQFGAGLVVGGAERSWALDAGPDGALRFHGDYNGNGDLSDDPPLALTHDGRSWKGTHLEPRTAALDGVDVDYVDPLGVEVGEFYGPGSDEPVRFVAFRNRTLRTGVVRLAGRPVRFGLVGTAGRFDGPRDAVYLDLDGDGELDLRAENDAAAPPSPERVDPAAVLTVGDAAYVLEVDPLGRTLTARPAPALFVSGVLRVGAPAPDAELAVLDGPARSLSSLRGQVVLLDFWGAWCSPCIAQIPELAEVHRVLGPHGLAVVSVNVGDLPETVRRFAAEREMPWIHAVEAHGGPASTAFQVRAFPALFVVDRDGTLAATVTDRDRPLLDVLRPLVLGDEQ